MTPPSSIKELIPSIRFLRSFISPDQITAIIEGVVGEEKEFFVNKANELAALIKTMPFTYQQDGLGDKAIVYLHYFKGGADWYITEQDTGDLTDKVQGVQHEAFGLADLFGDGGELGYISIAELIENNVELDFDWTPKTLGEVRHKQQLAGFCKLQLPSF